MKKWMYVIFPGLGLLVFILFYISFSKEQAAAEQVREQQAAEVARQEEAKKEADAAKARADAQAREREQQAEEAKKQAEIEAKWNATTRELHTEIADYTAKANRLAKQASELEIELDHLHRVKEAENRADFDLLKQVEQARVDQRNAELEIQRLVDMIARRAQQSSLMNGQAPQTAPQGSG